MIDVKPVASLAALPGGEVLFRLPARRASECIPRGDPHRPQPFPVRFTRWRFVLVRSWRRRCIAPPLHQSSVTPALLTLLPSVQSERDPTGRWAFADDTAGGRSALNRSQQGKPRGWGSSDTRAAVWDHNCASEGRLRTRPPEGTTFSAHSQGVSDSFDDRVLRVPPDRRALSGRTPAPAGTLAVTRPPDHPGRSQR
jgi:hypothetical protein